MTKLLVLDPGHGGRDPGAVGAHLRESDVNLRVSLLLRDALDRSGVRVLMTRETDVLPLKSGTVGEDLAYRARIANNAGADLYVSWHYDSSDNPSTDGVSVWVHPSQKGKRTEQWAKAISASIATAASQKDRGVNFGDFQVLRDTAMDAVLIEGGFISCREEEGRMADGAFLLQQAEGAAAALCGILGAAYVPPSSGAPTCDKQVAEDVIALYSQLAKRATPAMVVAANFAANAVRRAAGIPITTDLGKPSAEAAGRMEAIAQAVWWTASPEAQECHHIAADSLRACRA
ncbi:N-acetylmuramoyl-L-alanine amidase family protein [Tumebacillus permanentifrigoris]|uniref:N-acetylmuramoyl-L-alanine amidase n=1 Tax=Tumebacillus permanentifrigoris TaxID=378543 RepID=A0A316DEN7_9BACL|nr:N-acetylmuramoyl-L-alanine amidase [Tumebacillus permanentifrigoris]PWK16048.1 N-acetylmuramoyl-L-alanine amidase [Tumebacillus permanentifrigoris]